MKRILGLDLGTNSIGWALVEQNFNKKEGKINGLGSRIIPMSQDILGKFDSGVSISQTAERTGYRGVRRLNQRHLLRRERLHRVLNILEFLPKHYAKEIDFEKYFGQFKKGKEPKLNYRKNDNGKYEFLFMDSFKEMVSEFKTNKQETKIPYDWTIYYLRKKAISKKISKEELAWLLLNFNQKRGYYQLRGEDEGEDEIKIKEFHVLKVKELIDSGDKVKGNTLYNILFENGWIYDKQIVKTEDWKGKSKEFIVTTSLEKDKTPKIDKDGNIKRSFKKVDSEQDWIAIKKKTEQDIEKSNKSVGQYIYDTLLINPIQKINGKLVKTIERKFYRQELKNILKEQVKHHTELQNKELYQACINELYSRNEAHQNNIKDKGFEYLFIEDIIFYQRPLKNKKSTISNCQYEKRVFIKNGLKEIIPLKSTSKSNPYFQEFRLWQFLKNLKIYNKESVDVDVTNQFLQTKNDWVTLFDFLNLRKEIDQKAFIQYFISKKLIQKNEKDNYRWNYVEDKKYPCNETKSQFISRLKKVIPDDAETFLTKEIEYNLWHIVYSVKDKKEFEKALSTFSKRNQLNEKLFVENFKKFPPFKNDYGAYSEKALKKILPLMRIGKYWNEDDINKDTKQRIFDIIERLESIDYDKEKIENIIDDEIPQQFVKSFVNFKNSNPLTGLNTYQACYAVYERHSEVSEIKIWNTPNDIDHYLNEFKQHSLRNPIVEQVITETLRVVRDIWKYYGNSEKGFFNEIHVELGREMKNPADKRKLMTARVTENENTNQRIKALLQEIKDDANITEDVRPFSPSHQEILKIYEEGIFQSSNEIDDDIIKIRKNSTPSKAEIIKYKLWLEQGYISPYTGKIIPLNKLFSTDYQIEHIIPQSRYFDNSYSNKIICESEVNQLKDNQTAFEFLKNEKGRIVELSQGKTVQLFTTEQYENHCNKYFKKNKAKLNKLLSEDIPEGFIERQLNDSRYISKVVKGLLSNIVRENNEKEATSKNLVPVTGIITSKLKQDWGLNDKWNELVTPRFERLNKLITKDGEELSTDFGYWDYQKDENGKNIGKRFFRTQVPDEISKGFNKKRIDHRHHALDALVIACCTKRHTNYLGALNSEKNNYGLRDSLLKKSDKGHYTKHFLIPWKGFTIETKNQLEKTIISFKQNLRIINKTNNKTWQWVNKNGHLKKELVKQTKGNNWAIRKPMHKETVSGKVTLKQLRKSPISLGKALENWQLIENNTIRNIVKSKVEFYKTDVVSLKKYFKDNPIKINGLKIDKVKVYEIVKATATRTALTDKFTRKQLESITDCGIQTILNNHIKSYTDENGKEQFDLAFNPDGLEQLNKNIQVLNNGKKHNPIYKVRLYEVGNKFNVGETGNKKDKYVEAAKGTNLFFAIYWDTEKQKRIYKTIPLNEVVAHQKHEANLQKKERTVIPIDHTKGQLLFYLSPNDLVYIPTDEEVNNPNLVDFNNLDTVQVERIYKMVSCTGGECHFIPNYSAKEIKKNENGTNSKNERIQLLYNYHILDQNEKPPMIKERCWKLKSDRLGNIIQHIRQ